jgi:hypothetical protein
MNSAHETVLLLAVGMMAALSTVADASFFSLLVISSDLFSALRKIIAGSS